MHRRKFLRDSGVLAGLLAAQQGIHPWLFPVRLSAAEDSAGDNNPNIADPKLGATVTASSHSDTPTWGYVPENVLGEILQSSWETDKEASGAWLEIAFREEQPVGELWILPKPVPYDVVLDPYMRGGKMATPRKVTCSFSGGDSVAAELQRATRFQILPLARPQKTKSIRITIGDTWPEASAQGTGLGKFRAFKRPHAPSFDISVYAMYDVRDGMAVQSATLEVINPGEEIRDARLQVLREGNSLATIPLDLLPAQSVSRLNIWTPAPFEDQVMEFRIADKKSTFKLSRKLNVPAYYSYFNGGTFDFFTTNHNDLGWLDTQQVTADYRSAELILPAMELLKQYPDFRYSMESVIYLMEFLDRHPEKREEMAQLMRDKKFVWGCTYVQNLEVRVGPENLVRQFYLGRRWLKKNFPGSDSIHYCKTDPPSMTWQMPQILSRAGIKYVIQGRFPWGFYNWEGPEGSRVFVFAFRYADPRLLPNPKGNRGWLTYAADRESYYEPRQLPPQMIFDFNGDYLPPPPSLIPFVHEQNAAMTRFADKWNEHYSGQAHRQIKPPVVRFVEAQGMLDDFTKHELNVETVKGDWPLNWAYYDEPGHRAGLLAGRQAHNRIVVAERLSTSLMRGSGARPYPEKEFEEAWKTNCWPDHGWGGNRGTLTDANYVEAFVKSKDLADRLLGSAGSRLARAVPRRSSEQLTMVVYNPLSWRRTDVVRCGFSKPTEWAAFCLRDSDGKDVPFETNGGASINQTVEISFVADEIPSVGYRTYYLAPTNSPGPQARAISGDTIENDFLRVVLGAGGLKSLYDKRLKAEILKTDKFFGGEVLQFTAPGAGWDDTEIVTTEDFDKTSNHDFRTVSSSQGPIVTTLVREAQFKHFRLRQAFRLYPRLDRMEMDVHVLDWDGPKARELRVAFPINLSKDFRLSYEVPFGTVEMGKDEIDFSMLPASKDCQFAPAIYGGDRPLPFREAIDWIDASSDRHQKFGCLAASDCTVHLFEDQTGEPVAYPVLQHVLLSTRKSLAWNPDNWFTQEGDHSFRMALYPHIGGWRERYRDGIAFNYPLHAFVESGADQGEASLPASGEFLRLAPANLIMTALKKSEDDETITLRFFEAEGRANVRAHVQLRKPIRQAWKTNLIEEEAEAITVTTAGAAELDVKPWEIITLKLAV